MANQSWDEWAAWGFGAAIAIGVWGNKAKAHDDRDGLGSDRGE
jgi:hypothetical protein